MLTLNEDVRPAPLRLKLSAREDGSFQLAMDKNLPAPMGPRMSATARSIGTDNLNLTVGILGQLINAAGKEADANFALAAIQGIAPRDTTESLLATQMSAAHMAAMAAARKMAGADTLAQYEGYERAFNKLARTFAAQVEALKRYRTGGEQRVVVQHVTIDGGSQAIVGNVHTGSNALPGAAEIYDEQPHAKQIAYALEPALFSPDPPRDALSVASDAERPMPDARRQVAGRS
jgi:hypothetical protein